MMSRVRHARLLASLAVTAVAACHDPVRPQPPAGEETVIQLSAVVAGPSFVAVGVESLALDNAYVFGEDRAIAAVSASGATWSWIDTGHAGALVDVAYGAGIYVAVGNYLDAEARGSGVVLVSADGVTWESVPQVEQDDWRTVYSVTYGNGLFVVTTSLPSGMMLVASSPNGFEWTGEAGTTLWSARVRFALGEYRITGEGGVMFSSVDFEEWTTQVIPEVGWIRGLAEIDGRLVANGIYDCCFGELPERIRYYRLLSDEAGVLAAHESQDRLFFEDHVGGAGGAIALGSASLYRSLDMLAWHQVFEASDALAYTTAIAHGHGRYVVVGRRQILSSEDGVNWSALPLAEKFTER